MAVRMGPHFSEALGRMGAVGMLIELFADKDNPMSSRQLCASILAGLCKGNADNCREFRKKDGVEAIREEVVYRPDETTDNHLFYTLCIVDCVWNGVVGTRKNEIRFLDAGGLFALLDVLEVAPLLLKRQIIGCLADLMQYRKAAKLFSQWNSQVTMKGALKILLELWQNEQEAIGSATPDGVIRSLDRPLNPPPEPQNVDAMGDTMSSFRSLSGSSMTASKLRHARTFAEGTGKSLGQDAAENLVQRQDCRAKIYAVLKCINFECQESLSIAERQRMELVKLYPSAVELENWTKVNENLQARGIRPVSADRKWIEDSIAERKEQAAGVQSIQRQLANERHKEDEAALQRFYEDIRGRAQLRRLTPAKDSGTGVSRIPTPITSEQPSGYAAGRSADQMGGPSSGDESS